MTLCVHYNIVIFKHLKPRYEIIDRMEKQNTLDANLGVVKDYTKYFLPQDLQAQVVRSSTQFDSYFDYMFNSDLYDW